MIHRSLLTVLAFVPASLMAQGTTNQPAAPKSIVGSTLDAITVEDTNGPVTFKPADAPATVVIFVSAQCQVCKSYYGRMNALYNDYSAKHVRFIFANANVTENLEEMRKLKDVPQNPLTVPTYRDANNTLADRLDAHATPETYVIDRTGVVRYHGAIDGSVDPSKVKSQPLRNAIDAVVNGTPVAVTSTHAFGCAIKRKKAA